MPDLTLNGPSSCTLWVRSTAFPCPLLADAVEELSAKRRTGGNLQRGRLGSSHGGCLAAARLRPEAARAFYAGEFGEGDLPEFGQWRVLVLMGRHAAERRHALEAMRDEERGGAPCGCEICSGLKFNETEGMVEPPARPGRAR